MLCNYSAWQERWQLDNDTLLHTDAVVNIKYAQCHQCRTRLWSLLWISAAILTKLLLISIFVLFCSGARCSITVLPTKKVKASHPRIRVTFSPTMLWSRIQSAKTQRLGKDMGVISSTFPTIRSLCEKSAGSFVSWSAQVHVSSLKPLSSVSVKKNMDFFLQRSAHFDSEFRDF